MKMSLHPIRRVMLGLIAFLVAAAGLWGHAWADLPNDAAPVPALGVAGKNLVAGGAPFRMRGINWGWWHLGGTRYSEDDMRRLAEWGANTVRLPFSYSNLETDGNPTAWKEDGFQQIDEVVGWAKRYGLYVILDMHVIPGGQDPASYCAGGHNLVWKDPAAQERFLELWREITRRYRGEATVAAYELMNEPVTQQKTPELLTALDQRAITAIRAIDPDKALVVGGDHWSDPEKLVDELKLPDNKIIYTFHWYRYPKTNLRQSMKDQMSRAVAFANKFNVPVWVGEFGCNASKPDYQIEWTNTSISLFEEDGFSWTYWNDRETTNPASMALQAEHKDGSDFPVNERLLEALRKGWLLNRPATK
jgi:endo-1,4-beta-mannosidase